MKATGRRATFQNILHADALVGYRNVLAVVGGLALLQTAMAALAVVVALSLRENGMPSAAVGVVASAFAGGFLTGAMFSPSQIIRIGHIRSYAFFAAIAAIGALSFAYAPDLILWAGLQFTIGLCCAGLFAAGESWIADAAPDHQRGGIVSFYHLISKIGAAAGPFLVAGVSAGGAGFMIIAALFAASLLPIAWTSRAQPILTSAEPLGLRKIWKHAPAAAIAAIIAGAVNNAVAQLYPVYAGFLAPENTSAFTAKFNAVILIGAMAALWPAGLISDRIDRRIVVSVLAGVSAIAALGLALAGQTGSIPIAYACALIFGAGSLSYYGIAVAHAADRVGTDKATSMMAGILMLWGAGSIVGPLVAGGLMSLGFGPSGLFVFAAFGLAALSAAMWSRISNGAAVPRDEKSPYQVVSATSLAIAEIDPRGDEEQLDLFTENYLTFPLNDNESDPAPPPTSQPAEAAS